jgi:hypothetical protein
MKQEDIILMARKAGFNTNHDMIWINKWEVSPYMQRFAALVAAAATESANARATSSWTLMCKKLVAAENEACAKAVDHILKEGGGTWGDAIRARRQA